MLLKATIMVVGFWRFPIYSTTISQGIDYITPPPLHNSLPPPPPPRHNSLPPPPPLHNSLPPPPHNSLPPLCSHTLLRFYADGFSTCVRSSSTYWTSWWTTNTCQESIYIYIYPAAVGKQEYLITLYKYKKPSSWKYFWR